MFSSVCALRSPASTEARHSFIADELILAPSPSHSRCRNEGGDRNREEHGSGAGIELLEDSRHPRTQDCSNTANAKFHPDRSRSDSGFIGVGSEIIQNELPTDDEKARGCHEREIYDVIVEEHQREHRPGSETPPEHDHHPPGSVPIGNITARKTAKETSNLQERAEPKTRRKSFTPLEHHSRDPT